VDREDSGQWVNELTAMTHRTAAHFTADIWIFTSGAHPQLPFNTRETQRAQSGNPKVMLCALCVSLVSNVNKLGNLCGAPLPLGGEEQPLEELEGSTQSCNAMELLETLSLGVLI
jgi:hypothetical protein